MKNRLAKKKTNGQIGNTQKIANKITKRGFVFIVVRKNTTSNSNKISLFYQYTVKTYNQ